MSTKLLIAGLCLPAWLSAQSLHITSGTQLVMSGTAHLVMNNIGFANDGNFVPDSSTVLFMGQTGALISTIKGSNGTTFTHLTVHTDDLSGIYLQQAIAVRGHLGMEVGNLLLNGNSIALGNLGTIVGESSASRIEDVSPGTGFVYAVAKLIAPQAVNPGNIGVEITSDNNLGITKIFRYFQPQTLLSGGTGIARWYTIAPADNMSLNATLRIHYFDEELNGNGEFGMHLWTGSDIMAGWIDAGADSSDATANWASLSGIDHFNRVTLASGPGAGGGIMLMAPLQPQETAASPNPAHDQVVLTMTSSQEKDAVIGLYNQNGHLLQQKKVHVSVGSNRQTWNLSGYPAGIYFIGTVKVIKQ